MPDGENHVAAVLDDLVERLDHVAVAVHEIASLLPLARLLGATFRSGGDYVAGGFRWVHFSVSGSVKLEFIQPLDPDDHEHFLVRFLHRRGEGVHHLTFKVSDIHAAVARARQLGFEVVGASTDSAAWKEAFVHPRSAHGVLIQLAEWEDGPDPAGVTLDHVLGGLRRV